MEKAEDLQYANTTESLLYFSFDEDSKAVLLQNKNFNWTNGTFGLNETYYIYDTYYPSGYSLPVIVIASIFAIILMIFVVVGNLLVIVAIATEKSLKNIQNWFIASLAVADFFLGVLIIPFSLANELMGYWIFGTVWCDIHSAMDVLLCTASIMNLCLISLDRYWSITQAIDYLKKRTPVRAAVMITLVWILSAVICIPPLLGWKVRREPEQFPKCELSKDIGYVLYSALGSFYIPSCIMVFVYIRIYFAAKARARRGIRKPQSKQPVGKGADKGDNSASLQKNKSPSPSCITSAHGPTISIPIDTNSNNNSPMSVTIEPRPATIPIVTCDYASDASTSDNMDAPSDHRDACGGGKDTLKVFTTTTKPPLNSAYRGGSTLSINGDVSGPMMNRCRAPSVGIDADLVSEFDPSSSDSGVIQKCVTVKPLRLRLCKPIFRKGTSKAKREMIDMGKLGGSTHDIPKVVKQPKPRDPEREKRRVARKKEKRATLILGLIMGSFIACWLPFFLLYILTPICDCHIPHIAFASAFWLGYMNSALNPVIYTIFNKDFRRAFRRILFK